MCIVNAIIGLQNPSLVFENKEIAAKLADILGKYVVVPADKASNNGVWGLTVSKIHKNPYKQRFIAESSTCSTKPLCKLLTISQKLKMASSAIY